MKAYQDVAITTFPDGTKLLADVGRLNEISQMNPIHTVTQGQDLLSISFTYYGNHHDWVNIYLANDLLDPFTLEIGSKLVIPTN